MTLNPKLKEAIEEGQRARREAEVAAAAVSRQRAHREAAREQQRAEHLHRVWVEEGRIFDRIRAAVAKGESEISIDEGFVDENAALARVLNGVPGLRATHRSFRYRPADDCGEVIGSVVYVTWKENA